MFKRRGVILLVCYSLVVICLYGEVQQWFLAHNGRNEEKFLQTAGSSYYPHLSDPSCVGARRPPMGGMRSLDSSYL